MDDILQQVEAGGRRAHFVEVRHVTVRWEPYKPDGQRQMKAKGRWQEQVGSGDYWRWNNCNQPQNLLPPDTDLMAERQAALEKVAALEARIALMEDALRIGVDLISGDKVGSEWKRGCATFIKTAKELIGKDGLK